MASSADGAKLAAAGIGGQIDTSSASTTLGTGGAQYDSVELMYLGNDIFKPVSHEGTLTVR